MKCCLTVESGDACVLEYYVFDIFVVCCAVMSRSLSCRGVVRCLTSDFSVVSWCVVTPILWNVTF